MDNDHDGRIDLAYRGCVGAHGLTETPRGPIPGCGFGPELALVLAGLWWLRRSVR